MYAKLLLAHWMVLTVHHLPDSSESGGSTKTITAVGNVTNTRVSNHSVAANGDAHIIGPKVGSSAIAFDGTGDYLSAPDSADWTFGTGDFTLEAWVNITNTEQTLFSQYADASNRWYFTIDNRDAVQSIAFYHYGASCSMETGSRCLAGGAAMGTSCFCKSQWCNKDLC